MSGFRGLSFEKSLRAFSPSTDERIYTKKQLDAAVLAEREACAQEGWKAADLYCKTKVAAAIRARSE